MLARYLRTHTAPLRYAVDPNSPLSLLVRSRLLSQPMQQHEGMLPIWHEMGLHLPHLLDQMHAGHHQHFPVFLQSLQEHLSNLQQHDPSYQARPYMQPALLAQMAHLYQQRAALPEGHPLLDAYTHGSLGDQAGNLAGLQHLMSAMDRPTSRRAFDSLTHSDRADAHSILRGRRGEPDRNTLQGLLHAHQQLRNLLLPHGMSGPFARIAPITSGAIAANVAGREAFGQAHQAAIEPRHDRPDTTLPEDYYALSRTNPRRL